MEDINSGLPPRGTQPLLKSFVQLERRSFILVGMDVYTGLWILLVEGAI